MSTYNFVLYTKRNQNTNTNTKSDTIDNTNTNMSTPNNNDSGWTTVSSKKQNKSTANKQITNAQQALVTLNKVQQKNASIVGATYALPPTTSSPAKKKKKKTSRANSYTPSPNAQQPQAPQLLKPAPPAHKTSTQPVYSMSASNLLTPPSGNIVRSNKTKAPVAPVRRPDRVIMDNVEVADVSPAALGIVQNGSWAKAREFLAGGKNAS